MAEIPFRWRVAQALVVISFVWPYVNVQHFSPESTIEINFFFVFAAASLAPEVLLDDAVALILTIAAAGVAVSWGSVDAGLRVIVGVIPLIFLMGLYRRFKRRGLELIPRGAAYRTLQAFVGISAAQYIDQHVVSIIPGWLTNALTVLIPRYTSTPYDEFGVRGVQGWASEPSGAAVMCFSFCVVAILQQPEKRWRVFFLLAALAAFNKSIYAIMLLGILGFGLLIETKNKMLAAPALFALLGGLVYFVIHSARVADLRMNASIFGLRETSNREFARLAQIIFPLSAFPRVYTPRILFGVIKMEPMGLLPLLVGYGSVIGCAAYFWIALHRQRIAGTHSTAYALPAAILISFLVSPDFIPAVVAFAYSAERPCADHAPGQIRRASGLRRLYDLIVESAAARRRQWIADGFAAKRTNSMGILETTR